MKHDILLRTEVSIKMIPFVIFLKEFNILALERGKKINENRFASNDIFNRNNPTINVKFFINFENSCTPKKAGKAHRDSSKDSDIFNRSSDNIEVFISIIFIH